MLICGDPNFATLYIEQQPDLAFRKQPAYWACTCELPSNTYLANVFRQRKARR
jgi:hypothetical protein